MEWKWARLIGGHVRKIEGTFLRFLQRELKIALNNRKIFKDLKNRDSIENNL